MLRELEIKSAGSGDIKSLIVEDMSILWSAIGLSNFDENKTKKSQHHQNPTALIEAETYKFLAKKTQISNLVLLKTQNSIISF